MIQIDRWQNMIFTSCIRARFNTSSRSEEWVLISSTAAYEIDLVKA